MPDLSLLVNLLQLPTKDRQQLAFYKRSLTRPTTKGGESSTPRAVSGSGEITSTPVLGALHHRCSRSA